MSVDAVGEQCGSEEPELFTIRPEEKFFSKDFTIQTHKGFLTDTIIRTNTWAYGFFRFFDWRMHFNGYQKGEETVHAIKNYGCTPRGLWNLSFLGWFRPATLSDFDFYDEKGNHIGFIDGRLATTGKAHFDFYDKDGNKIAYAKHETTQIVIRDINTDADIAFLWRDVKPGVEDTWNLSLTNKLDRRIAFVFAAYIVNNQSYFLEDN